MLWSGPEARRARPEGVEPRRRFWRPRHHRGSGARNQLRPRQTLGAVLLKLPGVKGETGELPADEDGSAGMAGLPSCWPTLMIEPLAGRARERAVAQRG